MFRKISVWLLMVLLSGILMGCGTKILGPMALSGTADNEDYRKGFAKCFELVESGEGARYVLEVADSAEAVKNIHPVSGAFHIAIYDDGTAVTANIVYTVGAKEEKPTVVNPKILKGNSTVACGMTMKPKEKEDAAKRAEQIAVLLGSSLSEIEGK